MRSLLKKAHSLTKPRLFKARAIIALVLCLALGLFIAKSQSTSASNFQSGYLNSTFCVSTTDCVAVGSYRDVNGTSYPLIKEYNGTSWSTASAEEPNDAQDITLNSVTCASPTNCVAVGSYAQNSNGQYHALIETYDGNSWTVASNPDPGDYGTYATLGNVTCTSTTDCVAVGYYSDVNSVYHALIETYDGNSWTVASNPDPGDLDNYGRLTSIACVSATTCQAVGHYMDTNGNYRALIETYDGNSWTVASNPNPGDLGGYISLESIACVSATTCQAVGAYNDTNGNYRALIETYDGNSWTVASNPDPGDYGNYAALASVSCASVASCVAVGGYTDTNGMQRALIETYDGNSWTVASNPDPGDYGNYAALASVSCASVASCQAVGSYYDTSNVKHTLIETYDGDSWSIAISPDPSDLSDYADLVSVYCVSATNCVAIGNYYDTSSVQHALIKTYDGNSWSLGSISNAPGNITADNITSTAVDLHWQAPTNLGSFPPIQNYLIEYKVTGASSWNTYSTPDDSTHLTSLIGLLPNTSYTIRVKAINSNSQAGEPSDPLIVSTTSTGSYVINTCQDLQDMNNNLYGGNYVLGQDVDCSDTINWNGGKGFEPIGSTDPFIGTLNGNGHSITGLYENQPDDNGNNNAGLFDALQSAVVSNLTLVDPNITGLVQTGGLAAVVFDSAIANVQITGGVITMPYYNGNYCAGGLIGNAVGTAVTQSSFEGTLTAHSSCAGGLAGQMYSAQNLSSVANSYSRATINYDGPTGGIVGGLIGFANATIANSYAAGDLTTLSGPANSSYIGGLIGTNANDGNASILRSFSAVKIDASAKPASTIGGLVGADFSSDSVLDATDYFDAELAGTNKCAGDADDICSPINTVANWKPAAKSDPSDFYTNGYLNKISCASASSCQAVGTYYDSNYHYLNVIETYNGTSWDVADVDYPIGYQGIWLDDIDCFSASSCQAVGRYQNSDGELRSLVETYNGVSWSAAPTTDPPGAIDASLHDVVCATATSCQAVGSYTDTDGTQHTLVQTLDGSSWSATTIPDPVNFGNSGALNSVSCSSATSCAAVGYYSDIDGVTHPLVQDYNGTSWSLAEDTDPVNMDHHFGGALSSISCASTTFCVAVGEYWDTDGVQRSLVESYDGGGWSTATHPEPDDFSNFSNLVSVSCTSDNACQAVGSYYNIDSRKHALIESYSAGSWSTVNGLNPSDFSYNGTLNSVSCTSDNACQAVGSYDGMDNEVHVLVEAYNGVSWSLIEDSDPPGSTEAYLSDISCVSATNCQAVGNYFAGTNVRRGLIETYSSGAPNPTYFKNNKTHSPLNTWAFGSIWYVTSDLPNFIPGQIVVPVLPQRNPDYIAPNPNPGGGSTPSVTPDTSAVTAPAQLDQDTYSASTTSRRSTASSRLPDEQGVIGSLKHFVRALPVGVVVGFPYLLFGMLALGAVLALYVLWRETKRFKALMVLIRKQEALGEERDTFWHLAANYLRAPITLIVGGAELLSDYVAASSKQTKKAKTMDAVNPNTTKAIATLAGVLQTKVSSIMKKIEDSKTLRSITKPKPSVTRHTARRLTFLIPVLAVGLLVVLGNYAASSWRNLSPGAVGYITQLAIFVSTVMLFWWVLDLMTRGQYKREGAEKILDEQTAQLASARQELIRETKDQLDGDLKHLETQLGKLNKSELEKSPTAPAIENLEEGTGRLRHILTSFSLLVRLQDKQDASPTPASHSQPLELDNILGQAQKQLETEAAAKNVMIDAPSVTKLKINAEADLAEQVISSVLANAVEFSPKSGTVRVDAKEVNGVSEVTISDQGPGIDKEQLEHLFQPFTRTDGNTALDLNHEGLGLNLYLNKMIMEQLGGSITASSTPGKGTAFVLRWG